MACFQKLTCLITTNSCKLQFVASTLMICGQHELVVLHRIRRSISNYFGSNFSIHSVRYIEAYEFEQTSSAYSNHSHVCIRQLYVDLSYKVQPMCSSSSSNLMDYCWVQPVYPGFDLHYMQLPYLNNMHGGWQPAQQPATCSASSLCPGMRACYLRNLSR
jgi:hypothetical protein